MGYNISVGWETNRNELNLFNSTAFAVLMFLNNSLIAPGVHTGQGIVFSRAVFHSAIVYDRCYC